MLDGADEAPTLNELYEAIENIRKRSWQTGADAYARGFDEGFASADDWIFQNEDAMRDHGWVKDSRERRDLLDEIAWLHSELHGAEMEAEKLRKVIVLMNILFDEEKERLRSYSLLIDLLRDEWGIDVSWDGLREFWYVGLTEGEVQVREALEAENDKLRELVQITGYYCVNGYCEPGDGCPLLVDGRCTLTDRMRELGVEV